MLFPEYAMQERVNAYMRAVFGFMGVALLVTAGIAYYLSLNNELMMTILKYQVPIFIGQIALVLGLSFGLSRISFPTALALFFAYAASLGITLSIIFLVYTQASIVQTFLVAAGMFGGIAVYGYVTKTDLTKVGSIAIMMLWGMILASVINMFFKSEATSMLLAYVGVIVFSLLTAYDMQKIKQIGEGMIADEETMGKMAVMGALSLYLDFINLFLSLLRVMGSRRND